MESTPADKSAATETPYEQRIPSKLGERTQKGTSGWLSKTAIVAT
jgi:hypothetical protein